MKLKIKKNDNVQIIAGDDKGKTGRVLLVNPEKMNVLVEGVNIHIKHTRPSQKNQQGGRVEMAFPVHYSNVSLIDSDKKPTRVSLVKEEKGKKVTTKRVARSNGKEIN
jgi:large subunit ribosomal protein L24